MGHEIATREIKVVAVWLAIRVNLIDPSSLKLNIKLYSVKPSEQLMRNSQAIMSSRLLEPMLRQGHLLLSLVAGLPLDLLAL